MLEEEKIGSDGAAWDKADVGEPEEPAPVIPPEKGRKLEYINFLPPEEDEEAFWAEVLAAPPPRRRRRLLWAVLLVLMITALFGYTFVLQRGRGVLRSLLPVSRGIEFTLPIAETPSLEEKYLNPDGSYNSAGLAKAVLPSVVQIKAYTDSAVRVSSQGSGIIMSEDGYIVTNAHVISGADLGITVMLYDKSEYAARVVGMDEPSDIAVLKISAEGLSAAQFADSDTCELGEDVVAVGSPAGFENSVSKGIISGLDRMIRAENSVVPMQCIQIDAAINPGNSGGPLFNMWGQVVGITSSKLVSSSYDNIGFAITVNSAKPIIESLIAKGYDPDRGRVGILYYAVSEEAAKLYGIVPGLYIQSIDEDCDISNTELAEGDIITEMNGKPVSSQEDANEILAGSRAGDEMTCRVFRPAEPLISKEDQSGADKDSGTDDDEGKDKTKNNESRTDGGKEPEGEYFDITFKLNSAKSAMIEKTRG